MALQVSLDDPLPAEAAFWARLSGCRARLPFVGLQMDPQLERLATSVADLEGAAAALQLLLAAAWQRHCRARGEGQLPVIVVAVVMGRAKDFHGQAQHVQLAARPELALFRRHLLLDEGLVCKRAGGQVDQIQIVPTELVTAGIRVDQLPEAVSHPSPGAARGEAHLDHICAKDLEDVQHYGSFAGALSRMRLAGGASRPRMLELSNGCE